MGTSEHDRPTGPRIDPAELTISQLLGAMKPAQVKGTVATVFGVLALIGTIAFKVGRGDFAADVPIKIPSKATASVCLDAPSLFNSDGLVADFNGAASHRPLNSLGETFNVISDAEWDGTSRVNYAGEASAGADGNPGFLRVEYELRRNDFMAQMPGYVGIWTDFSYPPATPVDVSAFNRLAFDIRLNTTSGPAPRVTVGLASSNVKKLAGSIGYYDWCEQDVPPRLLQSQWSHVELSLAGFRQPEWSSRTHALDVHRVFRAIFAVKGAAGQYTAGYIDLDNIKFVL